MKIKKEDVTRYDLATIAELIKEQEVSPVEVALQLLERIEAVDPLINSFITIEKQDVLKQAKAAEQEIISGNYRGPLHGVPIGLKDLIFTQGMKTTMGSEIFQDHVPAYDATVVEKLKQAGAVIIGKLNTHQFAYGPTGDRSYYGPVRNPHNPKKMTGGSSSGSAAAVSASLCYGSLGTDTGGSIRIPASFCGVVGMKPTYGRVSKHGVYPLSWTLDHIGPLTRTVKDNAILLNALAGYDPSDPASVAKEPEDFTRDIGTGIQGLKIGVPTNFFFEDLNEDVREVMETILASAVETGAVIVPVELPDVEKFSDAHKIILRSDAYAVHKQNLENYPDQWDEEVKERLLSGMDAMGYEYASALQTRQLAKAEFNQVLDQVDVILTPTAPILPPNIDERHIDIAKYKGQHIRWSIIKLTAHTNLNGFPSLSIPCGSSSEGLPIGLQLIGKEYSEALLYRIGHELEKKLSFESANKQVAST